MMHELQLIFILIGPALGAYCIGYARGCATTWKRIENIRKAHE
mgnify:CR=1 FL=1